MLIDTFSTFDIYYSFTNFTGVISAFDEGFQQMALRSIPIGIDTFY